VFVWTGANMTYARHATITHGASRGRERPLCVLGRRGNLEGGGKGRQQPLLTTAVIQQPAGKGGGGVDTGTKEPGDAGGGGGGCPEGRGC
jgi:hypothetical protein